MMSPPSREPDLLPTLDDPYPLAAQAVACYRRDGHLFLPGVAAAEEVACYRPAIAEAVEAVARSRDPQGRLDDYGSLFTQVTNLWRLSDAVRRLVFARRFAGIAAGLLGVPAVRLYHDQALFKEPGGQRTPWHQDHYYWPLDTDAALTMWLALVDVSLEMGPMTFASGSHLSPDLGPLPISAETDDRLARFIEERGFVLACSPLTAGDATFHSSRTLHSARPNLTASRREVMTVIYFADGARVKEPDNPHRRVDREVFLPGLRPGEPAASPLNPVLFGA